jgi:hypothetical protein
VEFNSLCSLDPTVVAQIKRTGCVVVRGVVDESDALGYKQSLQDYVQANPSVRGFPAEKKQFFEL